MGEARLAMFQRLLVLHDGSSEAASALTAARALLATEPRRHLTLLRVVPRTFDMVERERVERDLVQLARALSEDGTEAEAFVKVGDPEDVVAVMAKRENADLIVLAPHHRQWLDAFLHRSLTAMLLSRAPTPFLLVPPSTLPRPPRSIRGGVGQVLESQALTSPTAMMIVPLDGSALAERSLPIAIQLAAQSQRAVLLLRALMPLVVAASSGEITTLERAATANAEREALDYLRTVRRRLAQEGCDSVQTMVLVGGAAEAILDRAQAHPGSIIVLSARGSGSATLRAVLGSVALAVSRGAQTPVIIVPEHARIGVDAAVHTALA
jgi:nucleotide-binding universal stress UspA family protein